MSNQQPERHRAFVLGDPQIVLNGDDELEIYVLARISAEGLLSPASEPAGIVPVLISDNMVVRDLPKRGEFIEVIEEPRFYELEEEGTWNRRWVLADLQHR